MSRHAAPTTALGTMLSPAAAKAWTAAAIAAIAALAPVAGDGISLAEALVSAGAFLAGFQATYWISNQQPEQPASAPELNITTTALDPDAIAAEVRRYAPDLGISRLDNLDRPRRPICGSRLERDDGWRGEGGYVCTQVPGHTGEHHDGAAVRSWST